MENVIFRGQYFVAYNTEMLILFVACYEGSRVNISEHTWLLF